MNEIIDFYGKYCEDKRLISRYGSVEYLITMRYLQDVLKEGGPYKILDVGAATGRYAIPLAEMGHEVTAVDLVPYHVGILRQKAERGHVSRLTARVGNALDLKKEPSEYYDFVLLFGPMYHLFQREEKLRALSEAKRVLKPGGRIFVSYIMNDFAVVRFAFQDHHAKSSYFSGKLDPTFHVKNEEKDLFSYDRIEDLDDYNRESGLFSDKRIAQDGPTHYIRQEVKEMDEETFRLYLEYVKSIAERKDLIGASCHVMDILKKASGTDRT